MFVFHLYSNLANLAFARTNDFTSLLCFASSFSAIKVENKMHLMLREVEIVVYLTLIEVANDRYLMLMNVTIIVNFNVRRSGD